MLCCKAFIYFPRKPAKPGYLISFFLPLHTLINLGFHLTWQCNLFIGNSLKTLLNYFLNIRVNQLLLILKCKTCFKFNECVNLFKLTYAESFSELLWINVVCNPYVTLSVGLSVYFIKIFKFLLRLQNFSTKLDR